MICRANQLTGLYMMGTLVVKGLNKKMNWFSLLKKTAKGRGSLIYLIFISLTCFTSTCTAIRKSLKCNFLLSLFICWNFRQTKPYLKMKLTTKQTNYRLMPIRTYVFISLHWETFSHNWKCLVFSFGTN